MVRNLGGNLGIAAVSTMLTRREQTNINVLGAHATQGNLNTALVTNLLHSCFVSQGTGPLVATQRTDAVLFKIVERQASMLPTNAAFRLIGIMFRGIIPFVMLMKRPAKRRAATVAH